MESEQGTVAGASPAFGHPNALHHIVMPQNAERDFCVASNALATKLMRQLERLASAAGGSSAASAAGSGSSAGKRKQSGQAASPPGVGGGRGGGRGRGSGRGRGEQGPYANGSQLQVPEVGQGGDPGSNPSRGDGDDENADKGDAAAGPVDPAARRARLMSEVTALLQASYRVGEKGIAAVDMPSGMQDAELAGVFGGEEGDGAYEHLDDITAANASIRSWRFVQVGTAVLHVYCCRLCNVYSCLHLLLSTVLVLCCTSVLYCAAK